MTNGIGDIVVASSVVAPRVVGTAVLLCTTTAHLEHAGEAQNRAA